MTIQEAYNKGLDDAETRVIQTLESILRNPEDTTTFPNPKLDVIREVVKIRSDYYFSLAKRNNNVGKWFRKKIAEQNELIDNSKL